MRVAPPAAAILESVHPAMQRAIATARHVATSDAAVLLTGESGTGKNLLAAAIHAWSHRHAGPLVSVPCSALADHLVESAPWLHAKGPATGDELARLEAALGGTLFLDEVADLPLDAQAKLTCLIAEPRLERVAAGSGRAMDARLIAATHCDLEAKVSAGRFREDLFFRLSVVTIALPPLRARPDDLMALTDHLLACLAARHHRTPPKLTSEVRAILAVYRWPGNVRELVNVLERALVLSSGDTRRPDDLPERLLAPEPSPPGGTPPVAQSLEEVERQQIERVLADTDTLEEAASRLGINTVTLWRKRKRYGFD